MTLETSRLMLRDYTPEDFEALYPILSDAETMQHYPHPFSEEETRAWIARNIARYENDGFGLWAVILKESGELIGDCGLTLQNIHGHMLPEIGYHIRKDLQGKGYATEAAAACIDFAFGHFDFPAVYSCMKYANAASARVAVKNGMHFIEEYDDPVNIRTRVYRLSREEWTK